MRMTGPASAAAAELAPMSSEAGGAVDKRSASANASPAACGSSCDGFFFLEPDFFLLLLCLLAGRRPAPRGHFLLAVL